jgi:hypothetical protein
MTCDSDGSVLYAAFAQDQLTAEESRKTSLEQRGLAVITSSGVLATLGFGALVLIKRGDTVPLPGPGAYLLAGSAFALLIAAILALVTNVPLRHRAINPAALLNSLREHWADGPGVARARIVSTQARLLYAVRHANDVKAIFVLAAMSAEVAGVSLLASTVAVVVLGTR